MPETVIVKTHLGLVRDPGLPSHRMRITTPCGLRGWLDPLTTIDDAKFTVAAGGRWPGRHQLWTNRRGLVTCLACQPRMKQGQGQP